MKPFRFACAAVLLVAAAAPLAAQVDTASNALRILNDAYTRSHDFDLVHQRIELRDFDWDSTRFTGRIATTLRVTRPRLDSVILDAGALLDIRRVTPGTGAAGGAAGGAALRTARRGDTLVVRLPRAAAFGDTVRFTIDYGARIESGRGLTFIRADSGRTGRPQQIWSQGQTDNNHHWFPTYDFPNDRMTWEVVATVPARYTAVSNGRLVADRRNPDGTRTMHWRQDRSASTYLVSLVVAPLVRVADRWRDVPVDYYVYPQDSALARPLFDVTPDMMEVFTRLTGVRYPWAKYAQTTVADFFGGMENVSASTMVDWLPDARAFADRPWYRHVLIPHELAHQWFGDLVTTENWANMWLNEGFAEFLPGQYWAAKQGRRAEDEYYVDEYRQYLDIERRRSMPLASLGSNNIYPKGALVLEMLKKQLGERPFWAAVNRYLNRHAYDNAVSDDFRQAVLDATGRNLDWFFEQWVYQAGLPRFVVTTAYDSTARRLTLSVKQTQVDTASADSTGLRFRTPLVFRMPVAVRVGTAAGDVVRHFQLAEREQSLVVDSLPAAPMMVVFDDGNAILKTLDFEPPTAWLAAQLARDEDLWNRAWAIERLAARTSDTAAAAALARAARGADWFATRQDAAAALGAFPPALAVPALAAATRDTSAQVREAAAAALGRVRGAPTAMGDSAVALLRTAWQRDTSYAVRAAAIGSLARRGVPDRSALLREALRTPSYQQAIQNAALAAVVQTGDTALVPAVEELLGEQQLPAYALAAMASRGSGRAMEALAAHLNDPRRWVREWVVTAFREAMPDALARARLQAAQSELRYDDTRRAVARLLEEPAGRPGT